MAKKQIKNLEAYKDTEQLAQEQAKAEKIEEFKKEIKFRSSGRPYIFTPAKKIAFLDQYVELGYNVEKACKVIGISSRTFYLHLGKDNAFKKAFDETNDIAFEAVTSTLLEAVHSNDWELKRWAVEKLMKSPRLSKMNLSETVTSKGQLLTGGFNKEDIEIG